ncbi:MAG: hypothetical protein DWQ02_11895 [Bacteroidetes bacterium]|nr:MAG: hypothetical protein DWQ02_11895 [Bacteroidota bacterium]
MPSDTQAKLISLFFGAFILFNFPIINILGKYRTASGIPLLYLYLPIIWILLIFFTYRIVRKKING